MFPTSSSLICMKFQTSYKHLFSLIVVIIIVIVTICTTYFLSLETNNDLINHGKFCFPKDFRGEKK